MASDWPGLLQALPTAGGGSSGRIESHETGFPQEEQIVLPEVGKGLQFREGMLDR